MTISSATRKAGPFTGNSSTTVFPFAFKVFTTADVEVTLSDGITETQLVLASDYSVSLNADQNANPGGSITYPLSGASLDSSHTLTLTGDILELQPASIQNQGGFYPKVFEDAFDRCVILVQQLRELANRSLSFPVSDAGTPSQLPTKAARANNLLGFDINGNPTAYIPSSQSAAGVFATLATSIGATLLGWIQPLTGAIARTIAAKLYDTVCIADFGVVAGTGTDQTAKIQAALDSGHKIINGIEGVLNITQLLVRGNDIDFSCKGMVLNCTSTTVFCAIGTVENFHGIKLHDFQLQGACTSEPGGQMAPAPLRGIVDGVIAAGNAHTAINYVAENVFERLHVTGATPGTNGFNLGIQLNTANYSSIKDCVIDSIYGTNSSFGYAIVCNGVYKTVSDNRLLSTIPGQGRHAVYLTNRPVSCKVIDNYCNGFQNEAITSNTSSPSRDLLIDGNTCENCLLTGTGTTAAVIDINAPFSKVTNNTITGTTTGSNVAGIGVVNANYSVVSGNTINGTAQHAVYITGSNFVSVHDNIIVNPDSAGTGNYGGIEIIQSVGVDVHNNKIIGLSTYRFGVRINLTATVSNNCQIFDNEITGSYSVDVENEFADPTNVTRRPVHEPRTISYAPGATSISLAQNVQTVLGIANSGPVSITTFPDAVPGQPVDLCFFDTNTTITRTNVKLAGGVSFVSSVDSVLRLKCTNIASGVPQYIETGRVVSAT